EYPLLFAPEQVSSERAGLFGVLLDRLGVLARARSERPRLIDVGCGGGHPAAPARGPRLPPLRMAIAPQAWPPPGAPVAAGGPGRGPAAAVSRRLRRHGDPVNVVDQAHDPLAILREAHRLLVAGGLLALRVPNARFHQPWARFFIGLGPLARSRGWDTYPVMHHFAFTPAGLRQLVERAGFEVLEVSNSTVASREPVAKRPAVETLPHWGPVALPRGAGRPA